MMEEEEETLFDQEGLLGPKEHAVNEKVEWKCKLYKTGALSMAFFSLGLCIAIPGPTLLDLGERVGKDTEHMAFIITARSFGYLLGAVVGGVLFDCFDQQILLFYTLLFTSVATAAVPWSTTLLLLSGLIGVQGIAMGVLDTGGNVFCIRIWGKKSAPYMQVLHFAFGVGAFLAPMIAHPFLNDSIIGYTSNSTKGLNYPVNIKIPTLNEIVPGKRDTRDLHLPALDTDFFRPSEDIVLNLHDSKQFFSNYQNTEHVKDVKETISHHSSLHKRDGNVSVQDESVEKNKNLTTGNTTLQEHPSTTTLQPRLPVVKAKKPSTITSNGLRKDHADGEAATKQFKEMLDNPAKINVVKEDKEPVATTPVVKKRNGTSLNTSFENTLDNANATKDPTFQNIENSTVVPQPKETFKTFDDLATTTSTTTPSTTLASTSITSTSATTTSSTASTTTTSTSPMTTTAKTTSTTQQKSSSTPVHSSTPIQGAAIVPTKPKINVTGSSTPLTTENSSTTSSNDTLSKPDTVGDLVEAVIKAVQNMSKIQFAYLIIGIFLLVNSAIFMTLYCKDKHRTSQVYTPTHEDLTRPPHSKCFYAAVLVMLFFFFFIYVGMEVTYGSLLSTFSVDFRDAIMTPAQAAALTAVFWGSVALGRGLAIFIARCFKPPCMLVSTLGFTVVGGLVLSFGIQSESILLWIGTIIVGLGMSSVFPTMISWADSYFPLTGKATAVFVAGSGIGEMTVPVLTGYLYQNVSRLSLMYMTLALSVLLSLIYIILQVLVCQKDSSNPRRSHLGFMRLDTSEDLADALDMDLIQAGGMDQLVPPSEGTRHRKTNGVGYENTELTKLVELSD